MAVSFELEADRMHNLLLDAIRMGASDIHIRPLEDHVDLLFRLDGALVNMRSFAKSMLAAVVSRISTRLVR